MATHYGVLAWRTPWAEEPGGLPSMGLQRVRHDLSLQTQCVLLKIITWIWKVETALFKSTWDLSGLLEFVVFAVRGACYGGAFVFYLWVNDLASWLVSYL